MSWTKSFQGYGHGTPSQRDKQYQRKRIAKASESVFEYQFNKEAGKSETAVVDKNKELTRQRTTRCSFLSVSGKLSFVFVGENLLSKIFVNFVSLSRSTIDRVVDDYISEAMRRGDFDNLKGSGKPLDRDYNPMVDGFTRHLNKMLIKNGHAPEWITLDKEIRWDFLSLCTYSWQVLLGTSLQSQPCEKWGEHPPRRFSPNQFRVLVSARPRSMPNFLLVAWSAAICPFAF